MENDRIDDEAEKIFEEILGLSSDSERERVLSELETKDAEVAGRVRALMRADERAGGFMRTVDGSRGDSVATIADRPGASDDQPGTVIGRYKLLERIGEGGFGTVYMAEQSEPVRRRVALKIIKLGMDTKQVVARFEAERQALALMDHPNIAAVFDGGATESGRPYFVMELIKGRPITEFCNERRLNTGQRLGLFRQVCEALQHAHQKGVIHRDLKPSNILVTLHGDEPVPKVIDFGIAKATQLRLTEKTLFTNYGQFVGTPAYMSPEQAGMSGLDVDTRSDIYSLGVLLYELLTGKTPVDSKSLRSAGYEEIRRLIREQDPPCPSNRLSTLQEDELSEVAEARAANPKKLGTLLRHDLDWVVMKALEKDPGRRYETAHGLSQDIMRYLNSEPVLAAAPSSLYRIGKLYRRHRVVASLAAATVFALIAGATISSWQALRATAAEREARDLADAEQAARRSEQEQREVAQRERESAVEALYRSEFGTADALLSRGKAAEGIASLARLVRDYPERHEARTRMLSALRHRSFALPIAHAAGGFPVRHASPDPTGSRMATVSPQGELRLWDLQTGHLIWGPVAPGPEPLVPWALYYGPDGKYLALQTEDKTLRVFDAATGSRVGAEIHQEKGWGGNVWFSRDGRRIVSSDWVGSVWIWSSESGEVRQFEAHPGRWIKWCEFSADGSRVVTCSHGLLNGPGRGFGLRVWDVESGEMQLDLDDWEREVQCARFTRDGRTLITASNDGTVRFYDASTGEETRERLHHPRGNGFFRVTLSPDESRLLTVSIAEYSARVWDVASGGLVGEPMLHGDRVYHAWWNREGTKILTKSNDRTVRVWDAGSGAPITEPIRHHGEVFSAAFVPGREQVLTTTSNHAVCLWDTRSGREGGIVMEHDGGLYGARFSPDGSAIVSSSVDGSARLWHAHSGRMLVAPLVGAAGDYQIHDAQFSPDGSRVVTASGDRTARVWDVRSGSELVKLDVSDEAMVRVVRFSPDGELVATASDVGKLGIWDSRSGKRIVDAIQVVDEDEVWRMIAGLEFSPDGETIVTAANDGAARLWSARSGEVIGGAMRHGAALVSASFSPDGRRVLTASVDWTARQWDAATGEPVGAALSHDDELTSAIYSPDGGRILTASGDGSVRLWDSGSGKALVPPMRHGGRVRMARFDPTGERIVSAGDDGTARIWDARLGLPIGEPIHHGEAVEDVCFNRDGTRILTASDAARLWSVAGPAGGTRAPGWLAEWAESVVRLRYRAMQVPEFVAEDQLFEVRARVSTSVDSDLDTQVAKWFFLDRDERSLFLGGPTAR